MKDRLKYVIDEQLEEQSGSHEASDMIKRMSLVLFPFSKNTPQWIRLNDMIAEMLNTTNVCEKCHSVVIETRESVEIEQEPVVQRYTTNGNGYNPPNYTIRYRNVNIETTQCYHCNNIKTANTTGPWEEREVQQSGSMTIHNPYTTTSGTAIIFGGGPQQKAYSTDQIYIYNGTSSSEDWYTK